MSECFASLCLCSVLCVFFEGYTTLLHREQLTNTSENKAIPKPVIFVQGRTVNMTCVTIRYETEAEVHDKDT